MSKSKNPFEDFEVISSYTDEQALDDGVLVDIAPLGVDLCVKHGLNRGPVNRMTGNLWAKFFADDVDLEIVVECLEAWVNRIDELHQVDSPSLFKAYAMRAGYEETTIWFVQNEVEGYTAMLPEDY